VNLRQLRYLCEVVDRGFNVSRASKALHTSQPGISKQILALERELGIDMLVRKGNRVVALTTPGQIALDIARRMLNDADNLRSLGDEFTRDETGSLVVATTHVHARYWLLPVVKEFKKRYPNVHLSLRQGQPLQIADLVSSGNADIGISTPPIDARDELIMLPCHKVLRCIITPPRHPLLKIKQVSLRDLAHYPFINLDAAFGSGRRVMRIFEAEGLKPNVVLSATDADVIKAYVAQGLGIAALPAVAFDPARDRNLRAIDVNHLFEPNTNCIEIRRNYYLRGYMYEFMRMFAPQWTREAVTKAMRN
jgi:LysR family transcriptional regulator, cys regulon transcriptional activator